MSNYEDKYLKYKKKYIDLKNEQNDLEGGNFLSNLFGSPEPKPKSMIFFYDSTNEVATAVFDKIKKGYKDYLTNANFKLNKPYSIKNTLKTDLNGLLNIFTYTFGENKVVPYFHMDLVNIKTSRRMDVLQVPLSKAINTYTKASTINFDTDESKEKTIYRFISCDNLQYQSNKILDYININGILNKEERINSTKSLLEIIKLYQNKTEADIISYLTDRIGRYVSLHETIILPSGTKGTITHTDLKFETPAAKEEDIKKKMAGYKEQTSTPTYLHNYGLTITSLSFNKLDKMIYFEMKGSGNQLDVLNIFDPFDVNTRTGNTEENTEENT